MDGDGVVAWWEVGVGGCVACRMVLTIYIIIWCACAVITLQVDCPRRTKIDIELVESVVIGHPRVLNVDLVVALIVFFVMHDDFVRFHKHACARAQHDNDG